MNSNVGGLRVAETVGSAGLTGARLARLGAADIEAWLGRLYPRLLAQEDANGLLSELCRWAGERLDMPMLLLRRAQVNGGLVTLGQSRQNLLWAELQQLPPRWDESFAGRGPAGLALRMARPVSLPCSDDGMVLWRQALEQQRITHALAWPLKAAGQDHVLEFYGLAGQLENGAGTGLGIEGLAHAFIRLIEDMQTVRHQQLLAGALEDAGNAAFITDLEGSIVWCNRAFTELSGYSPDDVIGKNPRFLNSGQQSLRYYRDLWSTLRSGQVWSGETVDRDKNGRCYTIQQTVSPSCQGGRVTHYLSIQTDISRQKQRASAIERGYGIDPASGLMTRAAFDDAAGAALRAAGASGTPMALALISMPGLQTGLRDRDVETESLVTASLAGRVRKYCGGDAIICASAVAEFMVLLDEPAAGQAYWSTWLDGLAAELREPVTVTGDSAAVTVKTALSRFPRDGETLQALRIAVERKLADEPMRPARRRLAH